MATDMDEVMSMSLDEYIATKKPLKAAGVSEGSGAGSSCSDGMFKAERRRQKRDEEAEDDDDDEAALVIDMEEEEQDLNESSRTELNASRSEKSFGIWRGPSMNTSYIDLDHMKDEPNNLINDPMLQRRAPKTAGRLQQKPVVDLRSRINNAPNGNCSSQQWRLMRPNMTMPEALQCQHNSQIGSTNKALMWDGMKRRGWRNRQRRHNGNGGGNFGGQPGNGNLSNNQNNSGLYVNHNHNNNGRVQRFNPTYTQEMLNKNISAVLERINSTNYNSNNCHKMIGSRTGSVRDLTIECPSAAITLSPNRMPQQPQVQQSPQSMPQLGAQLPSQTQSPLNQGLKALLGVSDNSFKTEMMPMLASKFLDFLQNGTQQTMHKPIYDMQIQKEIHELQKKPLMYKCPGGEVVSSDGAGIEGCPITPRASGVTLNYRFG